MKASSDFVTPTSPRFLARVVSLGALALVAPGCALVSHSLHQKVEITSVPAGATALVDDSEAGHTPLTVSLTRANSHRVELRKPGFAPARQELTPEYQDYVQRKVRFGVDIDSGAANVLKPEAVNAELVPEMLAPAAAAGDAFEQMSAAVLAADELWHRSVISEADHRYMIAKILAHFAP
jgi:hypothetical protein